MRLRLAISIAQASILCGLFLLALAAYSNQPAPRQHPRIATPAEMQQHQLDNLRDWMMAERERENS